MKKSHWTTLAGAWLIYLLSCCTFVVGSHFVQCTITSCEKHTSGMPSWFDEFLFFGGSTVAVILLVAHLAFLKRWSRRVLSLVLNALAAFGVWIGTIFLFLHFGHWHC